MKWKYENGTHYLTFSINDLEKLKTIGGIHTLKTNKQELIVVSRE